MLSRIYLFGACVVMMACSTSQVFHAGNSSDAGYYYDSAFNDRNHPPSSMSPPVPSTRGEDQMDPTYLRTQADYYFQVGEAQSLDGNHQKAVESFKMVLVYDPQSSVVHLRLSAEYVKLGQLTQALEQAELAVRKDSKSADAHILLGGLYSTLKVYDKAMAQYEAVLQQDPSNTEAPMYIGALLAEQKQYDKAVKYFEKLAQNEDYSTPYLAWYYVGRIRAEQQGRAVEKAAEAAFRKSLSLKHDYVDAVLALGSFYTKQGHEAKAIDLYKTFQREQGNHPRIAEILAQVYLEHEQYELAYEQLEVLEASSDDVLSARMRMALVLIEQKKYEKAVVKLKEVLRQVPESDKIRFYLAAIYEEMGKSSEAIENFSRIPAESQYYGESIVHAAYLLKQAKQVEAAIDMVKEGLAKRQDVAQFYSIYASLLDEKGEYQQAAKILADGSEKFPDNVQLQFFLGTIQDRLGDKSQVVEHMKKVIEMDPNHVQGLNYLAFTYAESNKNLEDAEKLARRALEIEPNDGYIQDTLGWILFKKGKFAESIKVLESALKNQPNEAIIAEHLGDAYTKHQLVEKARQMYQRAADSETDVTKAREIRAKITALDKQEIQTSDRKPASTSEAGR